MKRTLNTIGLKFTYLGATNTKCARYKVTQTNTNKSVIIDANFGSLLPFEFFEKTLNSIPEIKSFSLMLDNTQNNYYLFCIDIFTNEIPNLLINFKKIKP